MRFQTLLTEGRLLRRYKRFLADIELADGTVVTAHCANPGSMRTMCDPGCDSGARVWIEGNDDPRKKLRWSWKLVETGTGLAVVDTALANRVVAEALAARAVPGLADHDTIRAEVAFGTEGSRVDFLLDGPRRSFIEVKAVTMARDGWAEFPDSVTARGTRHLRELARIATAGGRDGDRAVLLFLVARQGQSRVRIAADIDPAYAAAFDAARAAGVEVLALSCAISSQAVAVDAVLPVDPRPQGG
ncbi:DNA/RNA nuclease SfsA [Aliigemmobacter aestuarii]|uniref:Sugar fermentation stimulation protein homolog n=1 Tax=Aliigemmobacter aestuarii TaxID=1445661 RepID=A0A4S3MT77_9RHOB|nr:DNA/RNA nuclease SfsA [Gemmobacter aestuarii]THD85707.1 DNA/RNA nuclease SfsA [Gemmobacter aestuarii]